MKKLLTFTCMGILLGGCGGSDETNEGAGDTIAGEPLDEILAEAIDVNSLEGSGGNSSYTGWVKQMHEVDKKKVAWIGQYKDGKQHGAFTSWYENGEKSCEGHYQDGNEEGDWVFYEEDGSVKVRRSYKNGKKVK